MKTYNQPQVDICQIKSANVLAASSGNTNTQTQVSYGGTGDNLTGE